MVLQAFVPVHVKVNGKAIGHTVTLQEKVSCIFQSLITYQNCGISNLFLTSYLDKVVEFPVFDQ